MNTKPMPSLLSVEPVPLPLARNLARRHHWRAGSGNDAIEIRPLKPEIASARIADPIAITARIGKKRVAFHVSGRMLEVFAKQREGLLEWDKIPFQGRVAVLEFLLEDCLDAIEAACAAPISIESIENKAVPDFVGNFGFEARWRDIQVPVCGAFGEAYLHALWNWADRLPKASAPEIKAVIALRRGIARLSSRELRNLRVGDGVVLHAFSKWDCCAVTAGKYFAPLQTVETGFRVNGPILIEPNGAMKQFMESDNIDETGFNYPQPGSVGDIPVKLLFDAGRIELPLSELESIGEGHIFTMDRNEHDSVEIIANGRVIGRGEIIVVDGLTAVRITALND